MICCRYLDDGIAQHFAAAALGYACQGDNCVCVFWLFIIRTPPKWIFDCLAYFSLPKAPQRRNADHGNGRPCRLFYLFIFFILVKCGVEDSLSAAGEGWESYMTDLADGWNSTQTPRDLFFFKRLLRIHFWHLFSSLRYKYDNFLNNCWFSLDSVSTLLAVPRRFLHPDSPKITKRVACSTGNRPNGKPKVFYFLFCFFFK